MGITDKNILLVISGGIAAYKALELIRLLKKAGADVRCILTKGGAEFVTPLSVAALSENPVYTELFSLKDETEMGHIRLSREADLIVVAPASANFIARLAHGMADDLAATTILASDKPVMICPAMNPMMWQNEATKANIDTLRQRGFKVLEPASGDMACGEIGMGRLPESTEIFEAINAHFDVKRPLAGLSAIVTAGPTHEPIDPVRFVANRSSGKQGFAIAEALATLGADVTLVTGPTYLKHPVQNIKTIQIETAQEMLDICQKSLPADIVVAAAAVADWAPETYQNSKIKKTSDTPVSLTLKQNPDILSTLSKPGSMRPALVIGFAAETENVLEHAKAKRSRKGCDWIVANEVSDANPVFGGDENTVHLITKSGTESWPKMSKADVAEKLVSRIAEHFEALSLKDAAE